MTIPFIAVIIMAIVTYIPRVLPVSIFRKEIKSPFIKSFLHYTPYAVLACLTFPAIFSSTTMLISGIIGTAVALILSYFEKSLVTVACAGIIVVYLIELVL